MVAPRHTMLWLALALGAGCARPSATETAQALVRRHREDEAVAALRDRLRAHPEDIAARRLLVRVLALTGDMLAARAEVDNLAQRMPVADPSPYIELGHALELAHRYDEALEAYDRAAAVAPSRPDGPREGGLRCAHWGEAEQAASRLDEAVRRGARDAETWHALGLVRLNLADFDRAEQAYREAAAADPRAPEGWLGLATVALTRGDAQAALNAYDELLVRRPRFAPAELGRAWALSKLGRTDDAKRALDLAEELGAPPVNVARQRAALH
jgi:tetratricopeptide (TPR) repeat protein